MEPKDTCDICKLTIDKNGGNFILWNDGTTICTKCENFWYKIFIHLGNKFQKEQQQKQQEVKQ